jgi:hypothetical protein
MNKFNELCESVLNEAPIGSKPPALLRQVLSRPLTSKLIKSLNKYEAFLLKNPPEENWTLKQINAHIVALLNGTIFSRKYPAVKVSYNKSLEDEILASADEIRSRLDMGKDPDTGFIFNSKKDTQIATFFKFLNNSRK